MILIRKQFNIKFIFINMIIGAIGDVHYPRYKELFESTLKNAKNMDLLLLAGDMVDTGLYKNYPFVVELIKKYLECPIIACFGNTEFQKQKIKDGNPEVKFLDDESFVFNNIGIVGTKGSLDRPTWWQAKNIPNIREIYSERVNKIEKLLNDLNTSKKILLIHYSPTYKTLGGENIKAYPELGCRKYEDVIKKTKPNIVIHAHAHGGSKFAEINSSKTYNVSLPLRKEITTIEI